jgi:hypothetical protein
MGKRVSWMAREHKCSALAWFHVTNNATIGADQYDGHFFSHLQDRKDKSKSSKSVTLTKIVSFLYDPRKVKS